jgi:uncharacterized membrane protein
MVFVPPALFSVEWGGDYRYLFAAEMALFMVFTMFLTAAAARHLGKSWLLAALGVTVGFLLLLWEYLPNSRYDAVVAFTLAGAAWSAAARRPIFAWVFLGLGTMVKLIPVLVTAALYPLPQARLRGILVFVGVLLASFVPAFLTSPAGFWNVFSYHTNRGLQIESFAASILLMLDWVEGITHRYGALEAVGGLPEVAATVTLSVTLILLFITGATIWQKARRGRLGAAQFPRCAAALLLAFIIGSKVLSPQYLIWLIPLVPLALRGVWGVGASTLLLLACWLTIPMLHGFYYHEQNPALSGAIYEGFVLDSQQYLSIVGEKSLYGIHPLYILLVRNVLLLMLWIVMLLAPDRGEAEFPVATEEHP